MNLTWWGVSRGCTITAMDDVREAVHSLRAKGWTIAALADELGVGRVAVERWTAGSARPANVKLVIAALRSLSDVAPPSKRRVQRRHGSPAS